MRILIGLTDIANAATTYAKGFRALGHDTFTVVWRKSPFYPDADYDVVIDGRQPAGEKAAGRSTAVQVGAGMSRALLRLPQALRCDVFIMFAYPIVPSHLYYPVLKRLGKRLVSVFWGSDIRYWYALEQEMRLLGVEDEIRPFIDYARAHPDTSLLDKQRLVRAAERYSDLILSQAGYGQLQRRPYMRATIPLDLSLLRCHVPEREVPLVLHAPSVRGVKGTEYVLAAVEALKQEGVPFEFRLIEKMPNSQLRELLAESDIVVDELFSETVGALSAEAMATGNVALVRYMADYARVPPGCPAVNVTKDTLHDRLREVIQDREQRRRLASAGRAYVEANNDHLQIARHILDWLEPDRIERYDFQPTFYQQLAIPAEQIEAECRVKWELRRQYVHSLMAWPSRKGRQAGQQS